jgi:predicted MFS family arabinose efflux permease
MIKDPMPTMVDPSPRSGLRRNLIVIFAVRSVLNTAHRIIYPFLPSIARGLGISLQAASGLVTLRLVTGLTAPLLGSAADRRGRRPTMEIALLVFCLANVLLGITGTLFAAIVAFSFFGLSKVSTTRPCRLIWAIPCPTRSAAGRWALSSFPGPAPG